MSKVRIRQLRELRRQADAMLRHVGSDLVAFRNDDQLTFVRTPESPRSKGEDDVNVTTTCSCLMSLVLSGQVDSVYGKGKGVTKAAKAFTSIVNAPWMSSGLTENNAFTTTLVLRTLGFLRAAGILKSDITTKPGLKKWELGIGLKADKLGAFVSSIKNATAEPAKFIWRSLSDKTRDAIATWKPSASADASDNRLSRLLTLDLQHVIEGSWIYADARFPSASSRVKNELENASKAYNRAAASRELLTESFPQIFQLRQRSFTEIAQDMSQDVENFTINEYPPTAAVVYWFVDGVTRAGIDLLDTTWVSLGSWATSEFNRQRSLVEAKHAAMMDPVAMAMAACICARLRSHAAKLDPQVGLLERLPSSIELMHAITELFENQTNGIWPKYFPLFHYQEAGSNFCFAFELLEAVLFEFGESDLLDSGFIVTRLRNAVEWCEKNLLRTRVKDRKFVGWNSGGSIETLRKGQPESWATAVVHMFLWELSEKLSEKIQQRLLNKYRARPSKNLRDLNAIVDIEIMYQGKPYSLKQTLREKLLTFLPNGTRAAYELRKERIKTSRSALLFGPPGTSKTELAEGVANALDWPLIQIDPSHFLRKNLDQIYVEAGKIFADLMDLSGVVILFDEMDALVQTRDTAARLDTAGQFLTTFMLPRLTGLHDQSRSVFFMATNFQDRFDEAIKRRGRFDLLLCMGPPTLDAKLDDFQKFIGNGKGKRSKDTEEASRLFSALAKKDSDLEVQLELYTFSEFKELVKRLGQNAKSIAQQLKQMNEGDFRKFATEDSRFATLQLEKLQGPTGWSPAGKSLTEIKELEIDRAKLEDERRPLTQMTRYVIDVKESRVPPI